jgi:hypothetical protein
MTGAYRRKPSATMRDRVVAGVLALVTIVLGLVDWMVMMTYVLHPLAHAFTKPSTWRLWDIIAGVVFTLTWLVLVYWCAYAYQRAVERHRLWQLFAKVTLVQVAVPAVAALIARIVTTLVV